MPSIVLTILTICAALLLAGGAGAQAGLVINSVQPSTVSTAASVNLVVTGSGFVDGAVVIVENFGALDDHICERHRAAGRAACRNGAGRLHRDGGEPGFQRGLAGECLDGERADCHHPTASHKYALRGMPHPRRRCARCWSSNPYGTSVDKITPGKALNLSIKLKNVGGRGRPTLWQCSRRVILSHGRAAAWWRLPTSTTAI